MTERDDLWEFWRNPTPGNTPDDYASVGPERASLLFDLVQVLNLDKGASILELGCNVGRNLARLKNEGYTNLHGIDINEQAISMLKDKHPDITAIAAPIEMLLARMTSGRYDLVYTMATLEHVANGPVFCHIPRVALRLITIEDELGKSSRHFPRNYGTLFTTLGMRQLDAHPVPAYYGFERGFIARTFER